MKKIITILLGSSLLMSFAEHPKTILTSIGVVGSAITSYSQTFLTQEKADSLYKPKNYTPYIFGATVSGTNYLWVDSTNYYEVPVTIWDQVQTKPDFMGIAYNALYTQLIGAPDLNSLPNYYSIPVCDTMFPKLYNGGYGLKREGDHYIIDTISSMGIMPIPRAVNSINTLSINIENRALKSTSITITTGTTSITHDISTSSAFSLPSFLTSEVDGSVSNELQTLSLSGNVVSLTSGGSITIPTQTTALTASQVTLALGFNPLSTETQSLSISSNSLSIKMGSTTVNTVVLPSATSQSLTLSTNSLTISSGNTIVFKRQEKYNGSTDATGTYSVTFSTAYSSVPDIQANVINGNNKWTQITNVSTTGFSVYIQLRSDALGLLPTYSNVSGATIRVLISEQ